MSSLPNLHPVCTMRLYLPGRRAEYEKLTTDLHLEWVPGIPLQDFVLRCLVMLVPLKHRPVSLGVTSPVWNSKRYNNVHSTLFLVPALSQMNPFCALSSCFLNIYFNIVLSFMSKSRAANSRFRPRVPVKKFFMTHPSQGRSAKNLYTKLERQTVSCRVNWAWPERVNLYIWQVMIPLRNTKTNVT